VSGEKHGSHLKNLVERIRLRTREGGISGSGMECAPIEQLIESNKPFRVETAAGRVFDIPHRDFVSFSRKKTPLIISHDENGEEHFAIVPLLTITSTMARA
jgi:hypothetical protein